MKSIVLAAIVVLFGCAAAAPAQAHDHIGIGIGLGGGYGCCGYYPYYGAPAYYPPAYYGYPAYYAPPPTVVYAAPATTYIQQAPPPVTYAPPTTYQQPQPQAEASSPAAAPTPPVGEASEPSVDSQGRTCRTFQSTIDGAPVSGTACLQPDGSWRTIGE